MLRKIMLIGVFAALVACGNSTDDSRPVVDARVVNLEDVMDAGLVTGVKDGTDLTVAQIRTLDTAVTPIAAGLFQVDPITPWANVPASGTATYFGGVELVANLDTANRVFGALTATTNFAGGTITGVGRDFHNIATGAEQTGTLALNAEIFRGNDLSTEFGISGALTGTLTGPDISGPVSVNIGADFADSGTVIYGGGDGTAGGSSVKAALVLSQD